MKLVFVHGRSQQGKDTIRLMEQWIIAFQEGLKSQGLNLPADVEVEFPFYGDRLYEFAKQMKVPLSDEITAKGGDVDSQYLDFRADMFEAFRQRADISDDQVNVEYGDNPKPKGIGNWEWVQAIMRALDRHVPGMGNGALELFTRDVYLYIKKDAVRTEIDKIVSGSLSTGSVILITHSLGTVVSYSVLQDENPKFEVPLYMTLGSPLGVRSIRNIFRPLKYPKPPVSTWYNAFDERDVVALYPLDAENFPVQPAIENNNTIKNDTENRHGITGYLKSPVVAKRIYDALVQR